MRSTVLNALRRNWWTLVLRGACAVLFGFFAWFWPGLTLLALILTWAAFACIGGAVTLASAFARDGEEPRWILLLEGSVSLLAGALALFYPRFTALLFLYLLAAWALLSGVVEIIAAWRLRNEIRGELWLGFVGALSVSFGLVLLFRPGAGALTVVWLIASYSVLLGIVLIGWGLHLRRLHLADVQEQISLRVAAIGGGDEPRTQ
jgi:uncharacterized membrane protein HdeD (DUF308 family)